MEPLLIFIGTVLAVYLLYKWTTRNDKYFDEMGIAHMKRGLLGNTMGLFSQKYTPHEFFSSLYYSFPTEKIVGMFNLFQPFILIRDPNVLKQLAIKDFDHFQDHRSFIDIKTDKLFRNSLFMMEGSRWRDMRATLSPAFTSSKMKQMFELVTDTAYEMSSYFKTQATNGKVLNCDMKEISSKYTNDVIASASFGIDVNSFKNPENEFFTAGKVLVSFMSPRNALKFFGYIFIPFIMKLLKIQIIDTRVEKFLKSMVLENMEVREKNGIFRPDMINILMQVRKGNMQYQKSEEKEEAQGYATVEESSIGRQTVTRKWSDDEIVAQCFLFFLAGFDTTSTLLSFLAYELAVNPDVQEKLYNEILETNELCNGKHVTYDNLQKMKYMDQVVSEALRKWPPAVILDRLCVKDYEYTDNDVKFTIKKGIALWIPVLAYHLDPKNFPNPDTFDPDRFSDERKDSIIPGTYIPFGIGPRNCIGSRFALMEVKAVIYCLLLNFKFQPNEKTQIPLKLNKVALAMTAENGINIEFALR